MSRPETIQLSQIMAKKLGSVEPSKFPKELFDYYSIPAFDTGTSSLVAGSEIGSSKQIVQPGDVLLSRIVPHIRRAWVVKHNEGHRIIGSGEWIVFRSDRFFAPFLRHLLISDTFHPEFMRTVSGVGGSLLRARPANVALINIDLPSLEEQRRIAAILDQAEALRAKRRRALAKLDTLTQSLFLEMFGDPALNRKKWPIKRFGDVAVKFSDGPFGSNLKSEHYVDEGVRIIRLQNIGVGEFLDFDQAYISRQHAEKLKKHECLAGDVLVGTLGDPNLRACIQPVWLGTAINKADCVQIRPDPEQTTAEWIVGLLNNPTTEQMANSLILGQTRSRIAMGRLRELRIPVPPLNLQTTYTAVCRGFAAEHEKSIANTMLQDRLLASLQYRAFRGEL